MVHYIENSSKLDIKDFKQIIISWQSCAKWPKPAILSSKPAFPSLNLHLLRLNQILNNVHSQRTNCGRCCQTDQNSGSSLYSKKFKNTHVVKVWIVILILLLFKDFQRKLILIFLSQRNSEIVLKMIYLWFSTENKNFSEFVLIHYWFSMVVRYGKILTLELNLNDLSDHSLFFSVRP